MITKTPIGRRTAQTAETRTVAAPVGGWNARDAYGHMDRLDAVRLENFWPGTNSVKLRKGYDAHVTGITGQVQTLMAYAGGATNTLFAAAGTSIYNATTPGAVGAAVLSSKTNAKWQHVNFTTSGGAIYLLAVNGADKLISWNGTAWHADGDGTHDITGFDTATATNITVFKNRIWLLEANKLKAWYLQVNAVAGAATALDMSSICQMGGYLVAAGTWTIDGGVGMDDHLVFITSKGEVLVWRLTDPGTPSGIALVGLWRIGAPIGRRCMLKYNGDILLITTEGVVPLSKALQSSSGTAGVSITDKIQLAMNTAIRSYGANFGWQLLNYPKANQLYLNVPVFEGDLQQQYVQNNITKSWCNFKGWEANCWELFNDEPYFGSNGTVNKAWSGNDDNGSNIEANALQSFQAYGGAREKHCVMIRFHYFSDGIPSLYGDVNTDYSLADKSGELLGSSFSAGLWDVGLWDDAEWGGLQLSSAWESPTGIGYTFAPLFKTATQGIELEWIATDLVFGPGGTL